MNTAVILNHSGVFHGNGVKRGQHHHTLQRGYHLPAENLFPVDGLKQLSLEKTRSNWTNLQKTYSPQILMLPVFNPKPFVVTSPKPAITLSEQNQHSIPNASPFHHKRQLESKNDKRINGNQRIIQRLPSTPQLCTLVNQKNSKMLQGHRIPTSQAISNTTARKHQRNPKRNEHDFSPEVAPVSANITSGHQQSAEQNIARYTVESRVAHKDTINNPEVIKRREVRLQDLLQTRKRSSPWPTGYRGSKKKPKDGKTKDYQIIEEYKNVEMDVAKILISDIPFPVVSLKEKSSRNGNTSSICDRESLARDRGDMGISTVESGRIIKTEKRGSISHPLNEMKQKVCSQQNRSILENADANVTDTQTRYLWRKEFVEITSVLNGGDSASEKNTTSHLNSWSNGDPNTELTTLSVDSEPLMASQKVGDDTRQQNGGTLEPTKQLTLASKAEDETSKSVAVSDGNKVPVSETDVHSMMCNNTYYRSDVETNEFNLSYEGMKTGTGRQLSRLDAPRGSMSEPTKQPNTFAHNGGTLIQEIPPSDGNTDSNTSFHLEIQKETYLKNPINAKTIVFTCEQCIVTFESIQDLVSHKANHTSSNFTFKCNVCAQVFRSTNGLQKHIDFHEDHRCNFQCSFCFKPFFDRDCLEKHIIGSHMCKRPHKCSYCPKAFRDPGSLQKHIRIHTGERPYKCSACEKSFAEYSSLRKHYRVHTGEQPYKCQYCSKAFSISGNLQRHILIHTGERPYQCRQCNKTFNNPSHLRRHEKNLHSKLEREK